jgi:phosphocarrier protein HPr
VIGAAGGVAMMTACEVTIKNRLGLHARAAAKFVHLASRFRAHIRVARGERVVDGKSIMGILLLAAAFGTTIEITADGVDEQDALAALCALVNTGFGEDTCSA